MDNDKNFWENLYRNEWPEASSRELKLAEYIEKHSYEVVVPYNIVFYITKINKQWYITLIDKVKDDCSE